MTERVKAILNLVVADVSSTLRTKSRLTRKNVMKLLQGVVVDISQNPDRRAFTGKNGNLRTLTTSSVLVDLGRSRMLLAKEYLYLQGHSPLTTSIPEHISEVRLRKLAGEGMALPCIGVVIWCIYLTKGFPRSHDT